MWDASGIICTFLIPNCNCGLYSSVFIANLALSFSIAPKFDRKPTKVTLRTIRPFLNTFVMHVLTNSANMSAFNPVVNMYASGNDFRPLISVHKQNIADFANPLSSSVQIPP